MSTLATRALYKNYGDVKVLKDVSLEIESGEFVVFVGPSGCGKSTLLRCIAGLEEITSGDLLIDDEVMNRVAPAKRGIAMVFQSYALYPHMSVKQNITYSLRLQHLPKTEINAKAMEVAKKLQLEDYLDRRPGQLSGGQRQRVAIGRAIVRDPKVFLFDEPLSNLDAALRVQMRMELVALKKQLQHTTMIYVTHDQVEAMTMADRIIVLRDGIVEQVGSPIELYENPRTRFVAGFIGSPRMNFLGGTYAEHFGAHEIGIRPEHLEVVEGAAWSGRVLHAERLGSDTFAHVTLSTGEAITCRIPGNAKVSDGETIALEPAGPVHTFDQIGQRIG